MLESHHYFALHLSVSQTFDRSVRRNHVKKTKTKNSYFLFFKYRFHFDKMLISRKPNKSFDTLRTGANIYESLACVRGDTVGPTPRQRPRDNVRWNVDRIGRSLSLCRAINDNVLGAFIRVRNRISRPASALVEKNKK